MADGGENKEAVAKDNLTTEEGEKKLGLGDRMKEYEAKWTVKLDPKLPFIIRLDGHKFSKFMRPFPKPIDQRVHKAMIATCVDVMTEYNATCGYTCSDEITLVFPVVEEKDKAEDKAEQDSQEKTEETAEEEEEEKKEVGRQLPFSGKVQKLISLTAGLASTCFNRHLMEQTFDPNTEKALIEHIQKSRPHFDSRVFQVPSNSELVNNLMWRNHYDWKRNSIASMARCHFSTKQLHALNSEQLLAKMKEKGVDWHSMPDNYKYGTFVKKEKYEIEVQSENPFKATRTRAVTKCFDLDKYTKEMEEFIVSKYLKQP